MDTKLTAQVALAVLIGASHATGQPLNNVGTRASALPAFVAVADDASAVIWNPAGLVTGPVFNILLDLSRRADQPDDPPSPGEVASRTGATIVALGTLPVGLSYYRLSTTSVHAGGPAVGGIPGRQDQQVVVRSLVTSHVGATVQQSLGEHLTIGATLKLVRGDVGEQHRVTGSWRDALAASASVQKESSTRGDVDLGAMAYAGRFRIGIVLRNITEPRFGGDAAAEPPRLARHARVGIAWGNRWTGISSTIVAVDADVNRVDLPGGARRDVAAGVEQWLTRARAIALRGGIRASTVEGARAVASIGGSVALRPGTYLDAYLARGARHQGAWGVAARLSY